jgi:hypothetical protein
MTPQTRKDPLCSEDSLMLYTNILDFVKTEISVIWTRYSAFLIVIGFIVAAKTQKETDELMLTGTNIIGIITCIIWYMMNFFGWYNQNYLYTKAYELIKSDTGLDTLHNKLSFPQIRKPNGPIYILAQSLPFILYIFFWFILIEDMKVKLNCSKFFFWGIAIIMILGTHLYTHFFLKANRNKFA